jgi:dihydrofolate synthase/folylpolyglutamate synthase
MNRQEAEDIIYASYLEAQKYQNYEDPDSKKRHPEYTEELTEGLGKGVPGHTICVTGSKGKGSVSVMLSEMGQALGYRTGLLTSPHIKDFNERIRFQGEMISDSDFTRCVEATEDILSSVKPQVKQGTYISPMGYQALVALRYFREKRANLRIMECGKGAKYDDVAHVPHDIAIINNVFLEHTRELGDTLESIAGDKSHILRKNCRYGIIGPQMDNIDRIFIERAKKTGTKLLIYGRDFWVKDVSYSKEGMRFTYVFSGVSFPETMGLPLEGKMEFSVPLLGEHQARNAALAITAMLLIDPSVREKQEALQAALQRVVWPGRMEIKSQHPFTILDATINRESAKSVKRVLHELGMHRVTLIVGIPDDKDYVGVVEELQDYTNCLILTGSKNPHYVFTKKQVETLSEMGHRADWIDDTEKAYHMAKKYAAEEETPIVILGTTSVISEYTEMFQKELS